MDTIEIISSIVALMPIVFFVYTLWRRWRGVKGKGEWVKKYGGNLK
jgi:hypothetical protein